MPINSIKKGKAFELKVANLLTARLGAKFHRVPQSGGAATNEKQQITDPRYRADIFSEDERFKGICIEAKVKGGQFPIHYLFSDSIIWDFVKQSEEEAGELHPVLFFKYSHGPIFFLTKDVAALVELRLGYNDLTIELRRNNKIYTFGVFENDKINNNSEDRTPKIQVQPEACVEGRLNSSVPTPEV